MRLKGFERKDYKVSGQKANERLLEISKIDKEPVRLSKDNSDLQTRENVRFKNKSIGEMVREKNDRIRRAKVATSLNPEQQQLNENGKRVAEHENGSKKRIRHQNSTKTVKWQHKRIPEAKWETGGSKIVETQEQHWKTVIKYETIVRKS